jgi:hypothetical protein
MLCNTAKARASFEKVLALDPTHPRALRGLARVTLEQSDSDACVDLLARALARIRTSPKPRCCSMSRGVSRRARPRRTLDPSNAVRFEPISCARIADRGSHGGDVKAATALSRLERVCPTCRAELAPAVTGSGAVKWPGAALPRAFPWMPGRRRWATIFAVCSGSSWPWSTSPAVSSALPTGS